MIPVGLFGFFSMVCLLPTFSPETYGWSTFTVRKVTPPVLFYRNCNCSYKGIYIYHWYILYKFVKSGATINSERYVRTLKKLKLRIRRVRSNRNLNQCILLHDNAKPNTESMGTSEAPCDSWVDCSPSSSLQPRFCTLRLPSFLAP